MTAALPPMMPVSPDRSTTLMVLAIFQVLLGCLSGLMGLMLITLYLLGPMAKAPPGQDRQLVITGLVVYFPLALAFIWLGIGLFRARRWAWTLSVVLAWMWLIMGAVAFPMVAYFMGTMPPREGMPPQALMAMRIVVGAFLVCIYILLPGGFLLLCHRQSVHETCRKRDPKIRWTDRCPMPVLALSIMQALSVMSMGSVLANGCVVPFFGGFISGAAGAVVSLLIAVVLAFLAWGTYRLRMAAWWGMLLLVIVGTVNIVATFSRTDLMEMYEMMGMPAEQLEMIRKTGIVELMADWGPWMSIVFGAAWLGYLLYVRRYFVQSGELTTATA